jgi:sec-independent protein translocase protein TatB
VFDIGWSEMAVILLVALVVIGPRDLPRVARTMGRWVAKGRAMAREFQSALEDMAREAELDKVKSEIEKAGRTNLGKSIENTIDPTGELGKAFDPSAESGKKSGKDAPAKRAAAKAVAAKPVAAKPVAAEPPAAEDMAAGKSEDAGADAARAAAPATPAVARAEASGPVANGQDEVGDDRRRTKASKREPVPADPS